MSDGETNRAADYDNALGNLLKNANRAINRGGDGSQYGMFIFGVYLEQLFGEDAIRETWDRDGSWWQVIRDTAAGAQNPKTIEEVLVGFAEAAYLFDFDHETDFIEWRQVLNSEASLEGDDNFNPNPRPRIVETVPAGGVADGRVDIEVGGFQAIEFQPENGAVGTLQISVFQDEHFALSTQLLRMERYPDGWQTPNGPVPTVCDRVVLDFTPTPDPPGPPTPAPGAPPSLQDRGARSASLVVNAECPYVTLLIAHQDPFGIDNRPVEYTATFIRDNVVLDDFSREYTASAGNETFGVASSGATWVSPGASTPVSRGADGNNGYVDGLMPNAHIQMPPSLHGQEFTATVRFRFNGPAGNGSNPSSWLYVGVTDILKNGYFFGHQSPFVEVDFNNGAPVADGQMGLWGGDANEDPNWMGDWVFIPTEQDVVAFTPGDWYVLKYHFVPGVKHESKIWPSGSSEPEYQISDTLDYRWSEPPGLPGSGAIEGKYLWLDVRGFNGRAEVDYVMVRPEDPEAGDDFSRTVEWGGWGTGELGPWQAGNASYNEYLAVDGTHAVVNQVAPLAQGDIRVGVQHDFVNTDLGASEVVFTYTQSAPATGGPGSPFIDNVFSLGSTLSFGSDWAGVEIYQDNGTTWGVSLDAGRASQHYHEGSLSVTYGAPINVRLRVDDRGSYARVWMASDPEPTTWTSALWDDNPTAVQWAPAWIVVEPRQTTRTGNQIFRLDAVQVMSGSVHGG